MGPIAQRGADPAGARRHPEGIPLAVHRLGPRRAALPGAALVDGDERPDAPHPEGAGAARVRDAGPAFDVAADGGVSRRPSHFQENDMNVLTQAFSPAPSWGAAAALRRIVAGGHWLRIAHAEMRRAARQRAEFDRLDARAL